MPILARGLAPLLILGLMAYCIFDIIATDESRIQNLPKFLWIFLVILIPVIGSVAWLLLGRPSGTSWRIGGTGSVRAHPSTYGHRQVPPDNLPRHRLPEEELPPLESRDEVLRRYYEEKRRREEAEERLREQLLGGEDPALGDGKPGDGDEPPAPD